MGLRFTGYVYIFPNQGGETKCDFCVTGGTLLIRAIHRIFI